MHCTTLPDYFSSL